MFDYPHLAITSTTCPEPPNRQQNSIPLIAPAAARPPGVFIRFDETGGDSPPPQEKSFLQKYVRPRPLRMCDGIRSYGVTNPLFSNHQTIHSGFSSCWRGCFSTRPGGPCRRRRRASGWRRAGAGLAAGGRRAVAADRGQHEPAASSSRGEEEQEEGWPRGSGGRDEDEGGLAWASVGRGVHIGVVGSWVVTLKSRGSRDSQSRSKNNRTRRRIDIDLSTMARPSPKQKRSWPPCAHAPNS